MRTENTPPNFYAKERINREQSYVLNFFNTTFLPVKPEWLFGEAACRDEIRLLFICFSLRYLLNLYGRKVVRDNVMNVRDIVTNIRHIVENIHDIVANRFIRH